MARGESQLDLFMAPEPVRLATPYERDYGLRYYQQEAKAAAESSLLFCNSTLLEMATGTGKTRTGGAIVGDWDGRALWLAHRDELVRQAMDDLEAITGEAVGLEQGPFRSGNERIVVASVQTVMQRHRLEELLRKGTFSLVVEDEVHHYVSNAFCRPGDFFEAHGASRLGLTATPDRGDGQALGKRYESVAYRFGIETGIQQGYLVPLRFKHTTVEEVDLDTIPMVNGQFHQGKLDVAMLEAVEGIVKGVLEHWPDRRGPCFFPGKLTARYAAERFNALDPGCAAVITDDTPKEERRGIIAGMRAGEFRYLCNFGIATEGFDWREADLVVIGRNTQSASLVKQMVGRGTRVLGDTVEQYEGPGLADERRAAIAWSEKPDCVVADFCGMTEKHDLASVVDVLGGRYTEAERKLAKKKAKEGGEIDVAELLESARAELRALAATAITVRSNVKTSVREIEPFKVFNMKTPERVQALSMNYNREPCTDKQAAALRAFGVEGIASLSKAEASRLLGTIAIRRKHGLATYKQMKTLKEFGIQKANIPFDRASAALNYLSQKKFGRYGETVDPAVLKRIIERKAGT